MNPLIIFLLSGLFWAPAGLLIAAFLTGTKDEPSLAEWSRWKAQKGAESTDPNEK